jgi:hypothetical protein
MTGYTIREREVRGRDGLLGYNIEVVKPDGTVRTTIEARLPGEGMFGGVDQGGVNWAAIGTADAALATAFAAAITRGADLIGEV